MTEITTAHGIELRLGDWREVLADVVEVDTCIVDAPYSERTHRGNDDVIGNAEIDYASWGFSDVAEFVHVWSGRTRSWICGMTSHDLIPHWERSFWDHHRYAFAPVPILAPRVRKTGDGPASSAVYMMVSRPKEKRFMGWGSLPGWYQTTVAKDGVTGGKPLRLMRAIVRDYSRPGDLIVDPCAGGGTTLIAAAMEGRRAIGAEIDPKTFELASKRIRAGYTPDLFGGAA